MKFRWNLGIFILLSSVEIHSAVRRMMAQYIKLETSYETQGEQEARPQIRY